MNDTTPAQPAFSSVPLCGAPHARPTRAESGACVRAWEHKPAITPLAKAALRNGIAIDDVAAYVESDGDHYPHLTVCVAAAMAERADGAADLARDARAVLAHPGGLEHARLWWRGVL